MRNATDQSYVS